jgi:predicted secreted protein
MPAGQGFVGRTIIFKIEGVAVAGVREKSIAINAEPIDVTADDSDGWREQLNEPAERQVDLSVSGVTKLTTFRSIAFQETDRIKPCTLEYPDGGIIAGDFFVGPFTETGTYNDAATFEVTLSSSGPVTYTPGP